MRIAMHASYGVLQNLDIATQYENCTDRGEAYIF